VSLLLVWMAMAGPPVNSTLLSMKVPTAVSFEAKVY
jgi:hypothetical protein